MTFNLCYVAGRSAAWHSVFDGNGIGAPDLMFSVTKHVQGW